MTGTSERVGYLLKDRIADVAEFVAALRQVAAGGTVVERSLVDELLTAPAARDPLAELTPREREVLALIAQGKTDRGIARSSSSRARPSRHTSAASSPSSTSRRMRARTAACTLLAFLGHRQPRSRAKSGVFIDARGAPSP